MTMKLFRGDGPCNHAAEFGTVVAIYKGTIDSKGGDDSMASSPQIILA